MVDLDDPKVWVLIPIAVYVAWNVGMPLSSARNEAALPLIGKCPAFLGGILFGNYGNEMIAATIECWIGVILFVMIPGAFGLGKIVLNQ